MVIGENPSYSFKVIIMPKYEVIKDQRTALNTNIAAGVSEELISGTYSAPHFNSLLVTNRDVVDIRITLDNMAVAGRVYDVPKLSALIIEPDEDIRFHTVVQTNLDAAVAETADKIRVTAMYRE